MRTLEPMEDQKECTISDNLKEMLVKQLSAELYNHNLYRTFANFFSCEGLVKLEQYYYLRAEEEYLHHQWILSYLNACDAQFTYPEVKMVICKLDDLVAPFEQTVEAEIETTASIRAIYKVAMEEADMKTISWLMGNTDMGRLIPEQVNFCRAA